MRTIAILGSTGSVGRSALEVVARNPGLFVIELLIAGTQWQTLASQIRETRPTVAGLSQPASFAALCKELGVSTVERNFEGTRLVCGDDEICQAVSECNASTVLAAIVGMAGLPSVLAAATAGKTIALANKESLVVAGRLVLETVHKGGGLLVPVDSEHSAIFQSMQGSKRADLKSVGLTASGGPFLNTPKSEFARVTVEQALRHPKWRMGPKISIDSATMFNKGLEVIEAHWLFGVSADDIEVVVHPESIVHSFARFKDGTVVAQLSVPDMKGPIAYALLYPDGRLPKVMESLDFLKIGRLTFLAVDEDKFPAIGRAKECIRIGGGASAVFNSANEVAVAAFLERKISFDSINSIVDSALDRFGTANYRDLNDVYGLCSSVVDWTRQRIGFVPK